MHITTMRIIAIIALSIILAPLFIVAALKGAVWLFGPGSKYHRRKYPRDAAYMDSIAGECGTKEAYGQRYPTGY